MAERAEQCFWMLLNTGLGGACVYELATGSITGAGWAALAAVSLLCGLAFLLILIQERPR